MRYRAATAKLLAVSAAVAAVGAAEACGGSTNNSLTTPTTAASSTASSPSDTPTANAMSDWVNGGGLTHIQTLGDDLGKVSKDASAQDTTALSTDCAQLGVDVSSAQNYGPIPNTTMQEHWSKALTDFSNAATECVAGAQNRDVAQLQQSLVDIESGGAEITIVDSAIKNATP